MIARSKYLGWVILLSITAACEAKPQLSPIKDTEGRQLTISCGRGDGCLVGRPEEPSSEFQLHAFGRVWALCPAGDGPKPSRCRPLVCASNGDCPWAIGLDIGACVNGLCTEPSHEVIEADAIMLCLAGTGLGKDSPKQVERYAMALQCGEPCVVPRPCMQF